MKKVIITIIIVLLLFSGCTPQKRAKAPAEVKQDFTSGVWFSFSEINTMLKSPEGFKAEFEKALKNCNDLGINEAYIHVRSYCDSLYPSEYFPLLEDAKLYDYDVFEYIVTACHQQGIKVHAWVNPYRVLTSSEDISVLSTDNPAYKWLNDENLDNDINVCFGNGIYLNPAESGVRELVISGIREIIQKYAVDGIHFDDYFYPTTDESFDSTSFTKYKQTSKNPLPLADWRRANVNALISGCYTAVKFMNKDIVFSVSPMASISKNYDELYADIATWVESGCIDCLIPQLYFGFDYPNDDFKFENLLSEWKNLVGENDYTSLKIGLATYKIGTDSPSDAAEWGSKSDIIARQAQICKKDADISGFICFSYSSLFSGEELNAKQKENLLKTIKEWDK